MFWILSMLVATSQGGIQSISRSFFGKIIPKDRAAEFFGFYNIFGKFSAIIGPLLLGIGATVFRSSRMGVVSIVVLFIAGGVLLLRIRPGEGEEAREA
jgi:UMF1 family MFS transporter